MENKDKPTYPCIMQQVGDKDFRSHRANDPKEYSIPCEGLTKREHFAAVAMQGILSSEAWTERIINEGGSNPMRTQIAQASIIMADELLKQLALKK